MDFHPYGSCEERSAWASMVQRMLKGQQNQSYTTHANMCQSSDWKRLSRKNLEPILAFSHWYSLPSIFIIPPSCKEIAHKNFGSN